MIRRFNASEERYEEVVALVKSWPELNYIRGRTTYTLSRDEMKEEELRALLRHLKVENMTVERDRGLAVHIEEAFSSDMFFDVWRPGPRMALKGYAYATDPPSGRVVESANRDADIRRGGRYYRHIEGDWYLYVEFLESD